MNVAEASLAQAKAQLEHQQADTSRTVALAQQGIMSAQARDEAGDRLQAAQAAVNAAESNLSAAQANAAPGTRARVAGVGFERRLLSRRAPMWPMRGRWPTRHESKRATPKWWRR